MQLSIIIPAHNEEKFIQQLLESIYRYIEVKMEVIVVDNGSTDSTLKIVENFDCISMKMNRKAFPSEVRNAGVLKSSGDYLVFLDADVVITKEWALELQKLIDNTNILEEKFITGTSCNVSQYPSWIEKYWFEPLSKKKKSYVNGANIITTRNVYDCIDGFDESLETGEDVDFSIRAKEKGITIILNDNWKVFHEGFPKTISAFIKRESWHGKGDLLDFKHFIASKVAIATVLFICLHMIIIISSFFDYFSVINIVALFLLVLLCYARAMKDIAMNSTKQIFFTTFISYLYFLGRSFSFLRVMRT